MAKFRLLAGQHIAPDSQHYKKGDIIESDTDLAVRFGREKFERIGDDSGGSKSLSAQNAAPNGQVSSGFQVGSGENLSSQASVPPPNQVVAETAREAAQMVADAGKSVPADDSEKEDRSAPRPQNATAPRSTATSIPTVKKGDTKQEAGVLTDKDKK